MQTTFIFLILGFSIILHEISHGLVAFMNGDPTAYREGRLTLNPLPHIDIFGSIILPVALFLSGTGMMFGWAKPVPFDPRNFHNRRLGIFTVGIAGPATNVLLALLFAAFFRFLNVADSLKTIFFYGASINLALAVFNMVPIPPLDGSRVLIVFLPRAARKVYAAIERWGILVIILFAYTGVLRRFIFPVFLKLLFLLTGYSDNNLL